MADLQYTVSKDELIVFEEYRVAGKDRDYTIHTDDLMLTDRNIVWTHRTMYGAVKDLSIYALHDIKSVDGRPQIIADTTKDGTEILKITFKYGTESFHFRSAPEYTVKKWVNAVHYLLSDLPLPYPNIPLDLGYIDVGENAKTGQGEPKTLKRRIRITVKCLGCRAPLTGFTGEEIKCRYCDMVQIIKDDSDYGSY